MDYKKKFEEACKLLSELYPIMNDYTKEHIANIVPWLKESEDERMKEAIIATIHLYYGEPLEDEAKKMIAWLEKQGETFTKKDVDDAYLKGVTDTKNEVEKQYEETYQIRKDIATFILNYKGDIKDRAKWIDYLGIKVFFVEKQGEQKSTDKVKPKFHEGEWVVFNNKHQSIYQVEKIENGYYTLRHIHGGTFRVCVLHDESLRLWTIQDAKDGDVLTASDGSIFLFAGMVDYACKHYVALTTDGVINFNEGLEYSWETSRAVQPATKEQRDRLEKAMADAGYEWDAEKKKLKKIGQIPANSAKTCKDAQNPAWSEDDEKLFNSALWHIKNSCGNGGKNSGEFEVYNWVKSLKDRVQPNQEWSEEDNRILHAIRNALNYEKPRNYLKSRDLEFLEVLDWLKSLRPQSRWKPSDEQMKALEDVIENNIYHPLLEELLEQLKKLRED